MVTDKFKDGLTLNRIKAGIYKDNENTIWLLKKVDRKYKTNKPPMWFLQIIQNKKAHYVSGVFKTKNKNIMSSDKLDDIGVKIYFDIQVIDSGKKLIVNEKKNNHIVRRKK